MLLDPPVAVTSLPPVISTVSAAHTAGLADDSAYASTVELLILTLPSHAYRAWCDSAFVRAVTVLPSIDISLAEIADILDYSDISHLSRVFSDQQGIGAQQFRRCYRNNPGVSMVLPAPKAGKIIEYIYRNFASDLTVLDVAERFNASPRMVNESLGYIVEMNFTNFLNYLRIHEAANLLLRTDQSVTDIAFQVGYNSLRSFNRNFLKWLKVTASEFRERVTEQKDTVDIGHLFRLSREEQS